MHAGAEFLGQGRGQTERIKLGFLALFFLKKKKFSRGVAADRAGSVQRAMPVLLTCCAVCTGRAPLSPLYLVLGSRWLVLDC